MTGKANTRKYYVIKQNWTKRSKNAVEPSAETRRRAFRETELIGSQQFVSCFANVKVFDKELKLNEMGYAEHENHDIRAKAKVSNRKWDLLEDLPPGVESQTS